MERLLVPWRRVVEGHDQVPRAEVEEEGDRGREVAGRVGAHDEEDARVGPRLEEEPQAPEEGVEGGGA